MSIVSVELTGGLSAVMQGQTGSIESIRDILILELLEGEWDKAKKSYSALEMLISKEVPNDKQAQ